MDLWGPISVNVSKNAKHIFQVNFSEDVKMRSRTILSFLKINNIREDGRAIQHYSL